MIAHLVAWLWRRRIARREADPAKWGVPYMAWKRQHPDRCMICAYTNWLSSHKDVALSHVAHRCADAPSTS